MPRARRIVLAGGAVVVVVALVLVTAVVLVLRRPLPDVGGQAVVQGLTAQVRVLRDARGVPQLYARDAEDLFFAQGFVQAQDRFFQMDVRRHTASGRLAELVGDVPAAVDADVAVRTMGWRRVAEAELPLLAAETRRYLRAYADGVNAYVGDRTPSELSASSTVLGATLPLQPVEEWTPVDSLVWLKGVAWQLKANYDDELGRALAYGAVGDVDLVEQLYPPYDPSLNAPVITGEPAVAASAVPEALAGGAQPGGDRPGGDRPGGDRPGGAQPGGDRPSRAQLGSTARARAPLAASARVLDTLAAVLGGSGEGLGSNAWVVSGDLTATGRPLLANDPHLAASLPGVWSQVGLHCTQVGPSCPFDVAGFSFAGVPGVVIGHDADVAWGFTNLGADVTDLFLEDVDADGTSLRDGERVPLRTRTETVRVAGGDPVEVTVRSTVHGPLLSDAVASVAAAGRDAPVPDDAPAAGGGYGVALSWTALTPGRTMDAVFALDQAQDWESFRAAASLFEVPAQNMVYADTRGHIGYQAPGRVPTRPLRSGLGQLDGTWPRLGWDPAWDWTGTIPFEQLPSELDPPDGLVVTANQAVTRGGFPLLTADWDHGYRAQRIRSLLSGWAGAGRQLTAQDVRAVQTDTTDPFAATLLPYLLPVRLPRTEDSTPERRRFVREAVDLLRGWDGTTPPGSAPAAYYESVWRHVLARTFDDQLPEAVQPQGGSRWFAVVDALLRQPENPWWDDVGTPGVVETRDQVLGDALVDARLELTAQLGVDPQGWQWGRLHRLTLRQDVLGQPSVPGVLRAVWTAGPVDVGGGSSVVDATSWDARAGYAVTSVPSMRMVVDLADLDSSTWVDLTGVSGHPWSGHRTDQLDVWADGGTFAWPFTEAAVEQAAEDELVLSPAPAPGEGEGGG